MLFDSDLIEPIIPESEFWELQTILERRKENQGRGKTGGYYFTSILKCGKCGGPMTGTTYKINNQKVKYYRCNRRTKGMSCPMPNISEENLTKDFLREFKSILLGWVNESNVNQKTVEDKQKDINKELSVIQKQMEKYKMMFVNDLIDIEELNSKIHMLREREKELIQQLDIQDNNSKEWSFEEVTEVITNFPKLWSISTDEERKLLISSIFEEIIVDADENAKVSPCNPKPFWFVTIR
jgi:site-specific DNA recombinase